MPTHSIESVSERIKSSGFHVWQDDENSRVLHCCQELIGNDVHGTTFRLAHKFSHWEVLSWTYLKWRLPDQHDPAEVAIEWMRIPGHHMNPPDAIILRFNLKSIPWNYPPGVLEQYDEARLRREQGRGV